MSSAAPQLKPEARDGAQVRQCAARFVAVAARSPRLTVHAGDSHPQRAVPSTAELLGSYADHAVLRGVLDPPESLTAPVDTLHDKYELLPAFLRVRGLVKQHIDSFNYLVEHDVRRARAKALWLRVMQCSGASTQAQAHGVCNAAAAHADAQDCAGEGEREGDVRRRSQLLLKVRACLCAARRRLFPRCALATVFKTMRPANAAGRRYTNIYVGTPSVEEDACTRELTPHVCRLRDCTYAAPIYVDVEYTRGKELVVRRGRSGRVLIGRLPLMLRSSHCVLAGASEARLAQLGECPLDPGGYFIVKGTEKVVLIQEQLSKNRIILDLDAKGAVCASVTSSTHERKSKTHITARAGRLYLRHNSLGDDVPLCIVLRAMGAVCDQEVVALVGGGANVAPLLAPSIQEAAVAGVHTQQQALDWLGAKVRLPRGSAGAVGGATAAAPPAAGAAVGLAPPAGPAVGRSRRSRADEARDVLAGVVLAHVPVERYDFSAKIHYVCTMAARVLAAQADPAQLDDKDYYGNKRLELAGQLLGLLFEDLFKRLNAELRRAADAGLSRANRAGAFDVLKCIRTDTITNGLEHALASGNWTVKRFRMDRKGVTQVLSRLSFISALGMMTRINSQFEKTRKVSGPRALQPSQWGMLCPSDTPEGEACGLVKNLALMTHVTTDEEEEPLRRLAFALGTEPLPLLAGGQLGSRGAALVFLNGHVLGAHRWPDRLAGRLRKLRRAGRLGEFVSVHTVAGRCYIASDGGRVCRPLIIVRDGKPAVTDAHLAALRSGSLAFVDFIARGLVEYLDVNEENDSFIALTLAHVTRDTTHLEIEPFTILGVVAGLIPYPHHNQSPRNTYQCAMGKQAMGAIAFNQNLRMDTLLYLLVYPQKPLVTTKTIQLIGYDRLGAGQNATVAVMSYSGYDIEDALVVNAASLDRGFGRCVVLRKHGAVIKKYANRAADRIVYPTRQTAGVGAAGSGGAAAGTVGTVARDRRGLLDADGIAAVGQLIQPGDVYVNKESPVNTRDPAPADGSASEFRPAPAVYRGEPAVVDRVLLTTSDEGQMLVKVLYLRGASCLCV